MVVVWPAVASSPGADAPVCPFELHAEYSGATFNTTKAAALSQCCDTCKRDPKCNVYALSHSYLLNETYYRLPFRRHLVHESVLDSLLLYQCAESILSPAALAGCF